MSKSYSDKNGIATYRIWDGGPFVRIVSHRARITPKRVSLPGYTWDGAGLQTSPPTRNARTITRLISYQVDGQPQVEIEK